MWGGCACSRGVSQLCALEDVFPCLGVCASVLGCIHLWVGMGACVQLWDETRAHTCPSPGQGCFRCAHRCVAGHLLCEQEAEAASAT